MFFTLFLCFVHLTELVSLSRSRRYLLHWRNFSSVQLDCECQQLFYFVLWNMEVSGIKRLTSLSVVVLGRLRPRRHKLTLAIKGDARNIFQRQLFKDIYWSLQFRILYFFSFFTVLCCSSFLLCCCVLTAVCYTLNWIELKLFDRVDSQSQMSVRTCVRLSVHKTFLRF